MIVLGFVKAKKKKNHKTFVPLFSESCERHGYKVVKGHFYRLGKITSTH